MKSTFGHHFTLDEIYSTYSMQVERILNYDLDKIGQNYNFGGYRLTYRFYEMQETESENMREVFSEEKLTNKYLHSSHIEMIRSVESWFIKLLLLDFKSESGETNNPKKIGGFEDKGYRKASPTIDSLYGEGGYVFEFDTLAELKQFLNNTKNDANNFENFDESLGIVGIDWVMYNANYNFYIYNALVLGYTPNGALKTEL